MQKLRISRETSRPHGELPAAWPDSRLTGLKGVIVDPDQVLSGAIPV